MEQTCPRCQRVNLPHAAFCASCGQPLSRTSQHASASASEPEAAPQGDADVSEEEAQASATTMPRVVAAGQVQSSAARRAVIEPRAGQGARLAVIVVGIAGGAALAAATGVKMATHHGRALPPYSAALRALPPPSSSEPEEASASQPGADDVQEEPAPVKEQVEPAPAKGQKSPAAQSKQAKQATPVAKVTPKPKPKPKPLGPPPTDSEINSCINKRKPRLRTCADQAAQRGEDTGWGTARATLNPDGKFIDIRVPGGGYFSDCATKVIRALRCRAFKGDPVEVRYPIR